MCLNWKKLERFKSVAGYKSLNLASKRLKISQSNISRDISRLEKCLSIKLYDRQVTGAVITKDGAELLKIIKNFDNSLINFQKEKKIPSDKILEIKKAG